MIKFLNCLSFLGVSFFLTCTADDSSNFAESNYAEYGLSVCRNGIVQVTNISTTCDSPYTYYWGNGAHRNSVGCNYGDKVTVTVDFDVEQDLDDDTTLYTSIELQNAKNGDTVSFTNSTKVKKYTSSNVNAVGSYQMTYKTQTISSSDNITDMFVPFVRMGFSVEDDGGSGVGGANIDCYNIGAIVESWAHNPTLKSMIYNYGLSFLTVLACSAFAIYLYNKMNEKGFSLCSSEEVDLLEEKDDPQKSLIHPPSARLQSV